MSTPVSPLTLWFSPGTPYPRRLAYYLAAKRLPRSVIDQRQINLVPVVFNPARSHFETISGQEPRPEGYSLPVLRVAIKESFEIPQEGQPFWITQSVSILEYLEETFPARDGFRELRGSTPVQRARVKDIVFFAHELMLWSNVQLRHGCAEFSKIVGIEPYRISPAASVDANAQVKKLLGKVEGLVREDVVARGSLSLAGGSEVTIADCVFAAFVGTGRDLIGTDWIEGFEALTLWYKQAMTEWFPPREILEAVEKGNIEVLFRG